MMQTVVPNHLLLTHESAELWTLNAVLVGTAPGPGVVSWVLKTFKFTQLR